MADDERPDARDRTALPQPPAVAPTDDDAAGRRVGGRLAVEPPRTALVTGAGRGIGRGLVEALAADGFDVALLGRTAERLRGAARAVEDAGRRAVVLAVDVTDAEGVAAAVRRAQDELGGLGLLVNNAGVIEEREVPFAEDDVADVWRVLEVNVRGPLLVTHAVLPGMLARGSGRIVNINSGAAHRPSPSHTGYGLSKGALARLTTILDAQYRAAGLRVFDLAPGVVRTDMTHDMAMHAGRREWTPATASADLVVAIGHGDLDALSGRFLRAGADTPQGLAAVTEQILAADARRLTVMPFGPADPLIP